MALVKEVVKSALRYCGEQTNQDDADDEDFQDGLSKLNQLWQLWLEEGLLLSAGQIELKSLHNQLNVPEWSIPGFELNLAKLLWPFYNLGQNAPFPFERQALDWENKIFTIAGAEVSSVFPGNLPRGMGDWHTFRWNYFPQCDPTIYPCDKDGIVTEGEVPIITESRLP